VFNKGQTFGLAHRLDRYTSGPLLIGKTARGYEHCKNQIVARELLKDYICLVHGRVEKTEGEVHAKIDSSNYKKTRSAKISERTGEDSVSIYQVLANYRDASTGEKFSLVHVRIVTGRTHQIRLHMSHLGHPLVGEEQYNREDMEMVKRDRKRTQRIFLHKVRIGFFNMANEVVVKSCSLRFCKDLCEVLRSLDRVDDKKSLRHVRSLGCGAPHRKTDRHRS